MTPTTREAVDKLRTLATPLGASLGERNAVDALAEQVLSAIQRLESASSDLYERVQMDESVGICLSERATTLALGEALRSI